MGLDVAAPPPLALVDAARVDQRRPLDVDADEHAAGRRPRERDLPRVDRVAGEEAGVLLAEAHRRARDRRRARRPRRPRSPGRAASYMCTRPVNETARSPWRTRPGHRRIARHARAFTEPRDVVSHTRPPENAKTSGVQCGPRGVGGRHRAEHALVEDLAHGRRQEAHPGVTSVRCRSPADAPASARSTRRGSRGSAATPPVHHARPPQTAPPTTAPAMSGRLPLAVFAPRSRARRRRAHRLGRHAEPALHELPPEQLLARDRQQDRQCDGARATTPRPPPRIARPRRARKGCHRTATATNASVAAHSTRPAADAGAQRDPERPVSGRDRRQHDGRHEAQDREHAD